MDFRDTRVCKTLSAVILFFFVWTFAGGYDIAHAAKTGDLLSPPTAAPGIKEPSPAAKLNAAMAQAEAVLADSSLTMKEKQSRLKEIKDAIKAIDAEMRAGFDSTEKHLKDKKLPGEIMSRHQKFVRHYESNYGQLMKDLNDLERAKKQAEFDRRAGRALGHLKEAKPKKRHQPLDPNKLPHRSAEPTDKKPRLKKEDFINELKAQGEPVLLASAGSIAGLLDANTNYQMLALASGAPTDDDLAETIEVQFTDAIVAKAAELNNDPLTIYEWVRNNVEFAPTWGSIQGADYCLQTMECNAMDTASLLIALLRASGVHARYAHGTIEMPIEKFMNWVGGFTDANAALDFAASGGIPTGGIVEGGKIARAQLEHVWVEAWIDYFPSRGAKHQSGGGDTWIPLDGSFKQYTYQRGLDLYEAMGINGEQYIMDYIMDDSPSPLPAELGNLIKDYVMTPYQYYNKRLFEVMAANYPDAENHDVFGSGSIDLAQSIYPHVFPYLLGTLPYKVIAPGMIETAVPGSYRASLSFSIADNDPFSAGFTYGISLAEASSKRITLSYQPASADDEALVEQYGGLLLNVPPYLIKVRPVLKIDGVTVVEGDSVGLGNEQLFNITFNMPGLNIDKVTNVVVAGEYFAIAIDYYPTTVDIVNKHKSKEVGIIPEISDIDDYLGQKLYGMGMSFFESLNYDEQLYSKNFQMAISREPSEAMVTATVDVEYAWGAPVEVSEGSVAFDVDRNVYKPYSLDGDRARKRDFMLVSGLGSSAHEALALQAGFVVPAVSASKFLKKAYKNGVPIHMIDSSNLQTVLPILQLSNEDVTDITNAVNAGNKVIVAEQEIQYDQWNGAAYIVIDPVKGSGGYMISGGLAGAYLQAVYPYPIRVPNTCSVSSESPASEPILLANAFPTAESVVTMYDVPMGLFEESTLLAASGGQTCGVPSDQYDLGYPRFITISEGLVQEYNTRVDGSMSIGIYFKRMEVVMNAANLIGTLYKFGCKAPRFICDDVGLTAKRCKDLFTGSECFYSIDCSGLVAYAFSKAGIESLGTVKNHKDAQMQKGASLSTNEPILADLMFFEGSYDKNDDCTNDSGDGATHVGIYIIKDVVIDAAGSCPGGNTLCEGNKGLTGVLVRNRTKSDTIIQYDYVFDSSLSGCNLDEDESEIFANRFQDSLCYAPSRCYEKTRTGYKIPWFDSYGMAPEFDESFLEL